MTAESLRRAWVSIPRMLRETASMSGEERGEYLDGITAARLGRGHQDLGHAGRMGWEAAMDGKRFAERHGLDMES